VLADPLVRRAVASALDREEYVEGVLDGNAEVVSTVNPPAVLGEHADLVEGVPYDPDEAGRLLDQAGWALGPDGIRTKDGRPLELSMVYARVDLSTLEYVQAKLAEVGIRGNIEQLDAGAYRERLDTGNYDLDFSGPNQNDANPAFLLALRWYSKGIGRERPVHLSRSGNRVRADHRTDLGGDRRRRAAAPGGRGHARAGRQRGRQHPVGRRLPHLRHEGQRGRLRGHPSGTNQRWSTIFMAE